MIGRTSTADRIKDRALSSKDLAARLARDKKLRRQLADAVKHGTAARKRAKMHRGIRASVERLARDGDLVQELRAMTDELRDAWTRVERKRSHKLRNTGLLLAAAGVAAVAAPRLKHLLGGGDTPS